MFYNPKSKKKKKIKKYIQIQKKKSNSKNIYSYQNTIYPHKIKYQPPIITKNYQLPTIINNIFFGYVTIHFLIFSI